MDASQYLKGIKRHWRLVAGGVTLAFVSAWASILVVSTRSPQDLYRATTTLIQNGASNGSGASRGAGKSNSSSTGTASASPRRSSSGCSWGLPSGRSEEQK